MFNVNRVRWALRKINLPINSSALVLDVGSGGNPNPRSDILLDRLTGSQHRNGEQMMIDRLCVFGDAEHLPFKNNVFDFVIASHILEHMSKPDVFISELQRVGKAGYIETPNVLFERFAPFDIHCLELLESKGVLHIHKKKECIEDSFLGSKDLLSVQSKLGKLLFERPEMFHVQYIWKGEIKYMIDNPEVSCAWIEELNDKKDEGQVKDGYISDVIKGSGWRDYGMFLINAIHSYKRKKRLKNFDLVSILSCPKCTGDLTLNNQILLCIQCDSSYPFKNGVPNFT